MFEKVEGPETINGTVRQNPDGMVKDKQLESE